MDRQQVMSIGAMLALAGSLAVGAAFGGSQGQSSSGGNKPSEFGRVGNQGEGFGKQDSIKGQGQNPESTIKQDAQVTLGGARPYIEGQVLKVQGDDYLIRDFSGSEIHVRVNKDTNMDCATPGGQGATMSTGRHSDDQREIPPTSHMQEQMSGQHTQGGHQGEEQKGKQIVQQNQQQMAKGQGIGQSQSSMPSGHQAGRDERTSKLDRNADLGRGTLGPHDGPTASSHSGEYTETSGGHSAAQQPQQGISHGQQSAMSGERVGDQSGTQIPSTLGKDSGGDIARGSGFTIGPKGDCAFKVGDKVRAEVSDLGTVLYIKSISDKDMKSRQARSGQMIPLGDETMPGEQASAEQRAETLKAGAVPAPPDQQNPDLITREGKQTAKADTEQKNLCQSCQLVRGLVMKSEPNSLTVKDSSEKEVKMKIDMERMRSGGMGQMSNPRAATFVEGDRVEAMVTPDGYAWSITAMKQQQGQPGILGAPGD